MYKYNNGKFNEILAWWDNHNIPQAHNDSDIIFYIQSDKPVGKYNYKFNTLEIDLHQNIDQIRIEYNATTRNEVNVKSSMFSYQLIDKIDQKNIDEYVETYNSFASYKGLSKTNKKLIEAMAKDGKIIITKTYFGDELLTLHSYYSDGKRMRLYQSFSTNNEQSSKINGLANTCHIDFDIQTGINKGIDIFDFGGIGNVDGDNTRFKGVINFKKKFTKNQKTYWKGVDPIGEKGVEVYKQYFTND